MRSRSHALATAVVLALGACTPTGVTTVGQTYPLYRTAHSKYALNGHDVFVIVQGGDYGADQAAFRQAVLDNMQRFGGRSTRFTPTPQQNYNSDYKVVMLFNGPTTAKAGELCARPEQYAAVAPTGTGEMHVLAAFCRFDAPLTEVSGRAAVAGTADARFGSLVQQTLIDLFPTNDERPQRDSDDGSTIP